MRCEEPRQLERQKHGQPRGGGVRSRAGESESSNERAVPETVSLPWRPGITNGASKTWSRRPGRVVGRVLRRARDRKFLVGLSTLKQRSVIEEAGQSRFGSQQTVAVIRNLPPAQSPNGSGDLRRNGQRQRSHKPVPRLSPPAPALSAPPPKRATIMAGQPPLPASACWDASPGTLVLTAAFHAGLARTSPSPRRRCHGSHAPRRRAAPGAVAAAAAPLVGEHRGLHAGRNMSSIRHPCACRPCSGRCTASAQLRTLATTGRCGSVRDLAGLALTLMSPRHARTRARYIAAQRWAPVLPGALPAPYASWASSRSLHRIRKLSDLCGRSLFVVFT